MTIARITMDIRTSIKVKARRGAVCETGANDWLVEINIIRLVNV